MGRSFRRKASIFFFNYQRNFTVSNPKWFRWVHYRGADKSLAPPCRKQVTATEDFEFLYILFINMIWGIFVLYIYIYKLTSN